MSLQALQAQWLDYQNQFCAVSKWAWNKMSLYDQDEPFVITSAEKQHESNPVN